MWFFIPVRYTFLSLSAIICYGKFIELVVYFMLYLNIVVTKFWIPNGHIEMEFSIRSSKMCPLYKCPLYRDFLIRVWPGKCSVPRFTVRLIEMSALWCPSYRDSTVILDLNSSIKCDSQLLYIKFHKWYNYCKYCELGWKNSQLEWLSRNCKNVIWSFDWWWLNQYKFD